MSLELQYLKTFYIVGMSKSFTKAAQQLHLTQPAISHQIKMLEESLGSKLFERGKKGLLLTEVGKQLLKRSRTILALVERVEMEVEGYQTNMKGTIRIGCPYELGTHWLAGCLAEFGSRYPDISFDLVLDHPKGIPDLLFNYNVDISFGLVQVNGNDIESREVFEETLVCVAGSENPFFMKKSIDLTDLTKQTFLMYEHEDFNTFNWLKAHKIKNKLKVGLVCNSYQAIKTWLLTNNGLAILPYHSVYQEVREGRLAVINPANSDHIKVNNTIYLSVYSETARILKFNRFIEFLKSNPLNYD